MSLSHNFPYKTMPSGSSIPVSQAAMVVGGGYPLPQGPPGSRLPNNSSMSSASARQMSAASNFDGSNSHLSPFTTMPPHQPTTKSIVVPAMKPGAQPGDPLIDLQIQHDKLYDQGAFGVVYQARLPQENNRQVAIKAVLQDKRYRNRELPLMLRLSHTNIVHLLYFYYTKNAKNEQFLNLVMEFIPQTLNNLIRARRKDRSHGRVPTLMDHQSPPFITIKLCMYQIFRALAYIHHKGICHRDIKPNNLLFNPDTGVLKVCDFGSAKELVPGSSNVSYICARYYRAPELLFGATDYTDKIDLWSTGVVFSELLLGGPIFHEDSGIDQLVVIISKLGTPTKDQIRAMNKNYASYDFPAVYQPPFESLFAPNTPTDALDLISQLFQYDPKKRISPMSACAHQFFDELRAPGKKWLNGRDLPPLFDFTPEELTIEPAVNKRLMPYSPSKVPTFQQVAMQQQQALPVQRGLPGMASRTLPLRGGSGGGSFGPHHHQQLFYAAPGSYPVDPYPLPVSVRNGLHPVGAPSQSEINHESGP